LKRDARTIALSRARHDDASVSTVEEAAAQKKQRSPWLWVSLVLLLACIGLAVWGINTQSDLDDANTQIDHLQNQLGASAVTGTAVAASYKNAYTDLQQQMGSATVDLSTTQGQLEDSQKAADQANADAAKAKDKADKAQNETDKANAQAEQAQAETKAAQEQTKIVTDCSQALLTSLGAVLQADDPKAEAESQKKDLEGISGQCKKALGGS
jgi:predicted  nucleic acid-binding Zn-ribbon protein